MEIDGAEVTTYESAAFFGELALLNGNPRKATVKAVEDCDIIAIDREAFKRLLGKAEGFCRAVWVPSRAMAEEADPEREQKRQEKLQRAKAQAAWREEWLVFNDQADRAAGRVF